MIGKPLPLHASGDGNPTEGNWNVSPSARSSRIEESPIFLASVQTASR